MMEAAFQLRSVDADAPKHHPHAGTGIRPVHLSGRQLHQFTTAVQAGNLFELKLFFSKLSAMNHCRQDLSRVAVQQLASNLVQLLSDAEREQTPVFDACLQLFSMEALSEPMDLLLPRLFEQARQTALLLTDSQRGTSQGGSLMDSIVRHVSQTYADESLSLASTAKELGFSAGYLGDYFKRTAGMNFTDYLISVRLEKAKALLQSPGTKAYEAAFACGFSNPHYFSVVFKKHVGITPTQFREQALTTRQV